MMRRVGRFAVRHRRAVVIAWVVLAGAVAPLAARLETELEVAARVRGSEAEAVETMMRDRFASPFARFAVLVITGAPSPDTPEGRDVLAPIVAQLDSAPGVSGTLSYLTAKDPLLIAGRGNGTFVVVGLAPAGQLDAMVPELRALTTPIAARLRAAHPQIMLRWTGDVPINHDIRQSSADDARRAEQRVLPRCPSCSCSSRPARSSPHCSPSSPHRSRSSSRWASPWRSTGSGRCPCCCRTSSP